MAMLDGDNPYFSSSVDSFDGCLDVKVEEVGCVDNQHFVDKENLTLSCSPSIIPKPPPLPAKALRKSSHRSIADYCNVPKETKDTWVRLFERGYGTDVNIITEDGSIIPAHFSVLSAASPVFRSILLLSKPRARDGIRCIQIPGVHYEAVYIFIRFLYSACYDEEGIKKYALHLMVLSHSYSVPSLKEVCLHVLERDWLITEKVIDVLQLARYCDAPRLFLFCVRMIVQDFKTICSTEGWKVMKIANPALEQELLESVVEADSRKQERLKKVEERKMYLQLYEAMEALIHICKEGCRTIGPCDRDLKGNTAPCGYPACKGIETLVRHFSGCKSRVPGGCAHCKRMWQLLELHSRMCNHPDSCMVPLCGHFKDKMKLQSKKEDTKWRLLVRNVIAARNSLGPFLPRRTNFL